MYAYISVCVCVGPVRAPTDNLSGRWHNPIGSATGSEGSCRGKRSANRAPPLIFYDMVY